MRSKSSSTISTIRRDAGELFVRFELAVLNDLGFGLDLAECAATGARSDLAYVSPKSGRAVSRVSRCPLGGQDAACCRRFLRADGNDAADFDSLSAAFRLTGFFLHRHVYEPRGHRSRLAARDGFIQAALKALNASLGAVPAAPDELSA
ncbi:DNA repair protein RecO [Rhizobium yanglingense]